VLLNKEADRALLYATL